MWRNIGNNKALRRQSFAGLGFPDGRADGAAVHASAAKAGLTEAKGVGRHSPTRPWRSGLAFAQGLMTTATQYAQLD
jgi:hypothetical protein